MNCDLEGQSEKFVNWLLGEGQKTERYVVCDDKIIFRETLASANVYQRGGQVDLTVEEVAEIRSTEETRRGNLTETTPGGAISSGQSIEIRHPRVEKIAVAGQ